MGPTYGGHSAWDSVVGRVRLDSLWEKDKTRPTFDTTNPEGAEVAESPEQLPLAVTPKPKALAEESGILTPLKKKKNHQMKSREKRFATRRVVVKGCSPRTESAADVSMGENRTLWVQRPAQRAEAFAR